MQTITLAQNFALLALDAQTEGRMTVAKRAALRGIAAAAVAELLLRDGSAPDVPLSVKSEDTSLSLYQQVVLQALGDKRSRSAAERIVAVTHLRDKQLRGIERAMVDSLMGMHLLDSVASLLSCDLYIAESGVTYTEYRAAADAYRAVAEGLRAEVLEDGEMTDDAAVLLWLLRECGALGELFTDSEWTVAGQKMLQICRAGGICAALMPLAIHRALEHSISGMLHAKSKLVATDAGLGLNFLCPIIERSQSVFIEVEGVGDNWAKRAECLAQRLQKLEGRVVEFTHVGKVPIVRLDNVLYEAVPAGVQVGGGGISVPVYGVRLRRYPTFQ